jgi:sucrose-6-phosphate hydrolase SacC (GH32 family)
MEVFINNGRRTVTKVVYPETDNLQLEAFADPGAGDVTMLNAWKLKPIW